MIVIFSLKAKIKEKSPDVYNLMIKCDLALGLDLENAEKHITENEQVFEDSNVDVWDCTLI